MFKAGIGLSEVTTADLKTLLRLLHRGEVATPLDVTELARVGLQHCAIELLGHLRGLEATAIKAVVIAVIAERNARTRGGGQPA